MPHLRRHRGGFLVSGSGTAYKPPRPDALFVAGLAADVKPGLVVRQDGVLGLAGQVVLVRQVDEPGPLAAVIYDHGSIFRAACCARQGQQ